MHVCTAHQPSKRFRMYLTDVALYEYINYNYSYSHLVPETYEAGVNHTDLQAYTPVRSLYVFFVTANL